MAEILTLSHLGDLKRSMPRGWNPPPPLFISVVAWDMAAKLGTKVVDYINNGFLKQLFNYHCCYCC